jgi:hypothetical protein
MDIHTTLYDTWQPGATANAESMLFQTPQGGDSTHTEAFTNMRGGGQLPSGEKFVLKKIKLIIDEQIAEADFDTRLFNAFVEFRLKDKTVFKSPASMLFAHSSYGGHFTQATAALTQAIGPMGTGFELEIPIVIEGGERFQVRCVQGAAFASAIDHKVVLEGILSLPD